jgi:hypothetical protein
MSSPSSFAVPCQYHSSSTPLSSSSTYRCYKDSWVKPRRLQNPMPFENHRSLDRQLSLSLAFIYGNSNW